MITLTIQRFVAWSTILVNNQLSMIPKCLLCINLPPLSPVLVPQMDITMKHTILISLIRSIFHFCTYLIELMMYVERVFRNHKNVPLSGLFEAPADQCS